MTTRTWHGPLREQRALSAEERRDRIGELAAEGVDLSLLAEQLRLSPTARIESMLRLNELCAALVEAGTHDERLQ